MKVAGIPAEHLSGERRDDSVVQHAAMVYPRNGVVVRYTDMRPDVLALRMPWGSQCSREMAAQLVSHCVPAPQLWQCVEGVSEQQVGQQSVTQPHLQRPNRARWQVLFNVRTNRMREATDIVATQGIVTRDRGRTVRRSEGCELAGNHSCVP